MRHLLHALALGGLLTAAGAAAETSCRAPETLARGLFDGSVRWGSLEVAGRYGLDEAALDEGRLQAIVEASLTRPAIDSLQDLGSATLCVSLVLDVEGDLPVAHHRRLDIGDLSAAETWSYGVRVDLPEATAQLLVIVEEPASGLWGAAIADEMGESTGPGPAAVRLAGSEEAWYEITRPTGAPTTSRAQPTVVRLVPPRRQPVSGTTRFDALVSSTAVARVGFELDGEEVASRKRTLLERPFAARIDLADPPRLQTLRAVAYDSDGRELGSDTLVVNEIDAPLRVHISELSGDPASGSVELAANVTVPTGARLERVEVYRNQTLVARFDSAPVRTRVPTPDAGPEDYVRVAAFLTDGSSIDDVVLLADPGGAEKVEVNLVELHVVVTDGDGQTVEDLALEDFTIVHQGNRQPPQSFAYADDVTLLLGLVVDTSGSMKPLMHDTRKAAAKFLGSTVLPQDSAFLVGFDLQPRLLHPTTSDLPLLLRDLTKLQADGATALYDAIVFSMPQFDSQGGRKALVVLSDGDDHESRFGPRYCIELGQKTGVPIYVIGLGGLSVYGSLRPYSKKDLRRITSETGGRLYLVDSISELDRAYAQINAELRSQYSLSFYTDDDLDTAERRDVKVEIRRPGLTARTVVGVPRRSP